MPVSITVAPSPKKRRSTNVGESKYLVDLAREIADDQPGSRVVARYGDGAADVMVVRKAADDVVEWF